MAETFDIGVHKVLLTFGVVVEGNLQPDTGLLNNIDIRFIRADDSTVIVAGGFTEVGNGKYQFWDFAIPAITFTQGGADYQGSLELLVQKYNGSIWVTQGGTIRVYRNASQFDGFDDYPPSRTFVESRVDRQGDTCFGWLSYDNANWNGVTGLTSPADYNLVHKKWVQDNFIDGTSGDYVTVAGTQSITGAKTASNFTFDVGNSTISSPKFKIQSASNPPNGGTMVMSVGYNSNNKPDIKFHNSTIDSDGTCNMNRMKIKTSSGVYISGIATQNDFIWRKFADDNYVRIGSGFDTNTIIIDSRVQNDVPFKEYSTIGFALLDLLSGSNPRPLSSSSVWTLKVRQHSSSIGYTESIEVPDWVNLVGDGMVNITGQLTRPASAVTLQSSKLQNLIISSEFGQSHDVLRFECVDCVFIADDTVDLEKSNLRNCEFFGTAITSSDNNKIKGCFGNRAVTWQSNDVVWNYDFVVGASY